MAKNTKQTPSSADYKEFRQAHPEAGVGLGKDSAGLYVKTHRARSKSYPSAAKIPKSAVKFVESTG